jgi:ABC-2 type transport system ATP-binding protein
MLELVGLTESAEMRLSKYSRGMLQRLGIAQALINDPELVILDEPASGLDPIGQKEMRNVILRLKDQGKTVLLSSHQLSEVEAICDSVSIVDRGRVRREGTLDELLNVSNANSITALGQGNGLEEALSGVAEEVVRTGDTYRIAVPAAKTYEALDVLEARGLALQEVLPKRLSLEEYFIQLVEGERRGD